MQRLRPVADLCIVALISALALLVTLLVRGVAPLHVVLAAPLVLILPGYALAAVVLPRSALGTIERFTVGLGLSLALAACGGLILNATSWGLTAATWTVLLGAVTIVACCVAAARRLADQPTPAAFASPRVELHTGAIALFGLALLIVVGALRFTSIPPAELSEQGYTLLWAVPEPATPATVHVGVQNLEATPQSFVLRINQNDRSLNEWSLQLDSATTWQTDVTLPPQTPSDGDVSVLLYPSNNPDTPVRQAIIRRST